MPSVKLKALQEGTVFSYEGKTYRVVGYCKPFPDGPKSDPWASIAVKALVEPKLGGKFQPLLMQLMNGNFTVWVDDGT